MFVLFDITLAEADETCLFVAHTCNLHPMSFVFCAENGKLTVSRPAIVLYHHPTLKIEDLEKRRSMSLALQYIMFVFVNLNLVLVAVDGLLTRKCENVWHRGRWVSVAAGRALRKNRRSSCVQLLLL